MCTLRNFPHFTEHCIEWARAQFSDWFADLPAEVNCLITDRNEYFGKLSKEGNAGVQVYALTEALHIALIVVSGRRAASCARHHRYIARGFP